MPRRPRRSGAQPAPGRSAATRAAAAWHRSRRAGRRSSARSPAPWPAPRGSRDSPAGRSAGPRPSPGPRPPGRRRRQPGRHGLGEDEPEPLLDVGRQKQSRPYVFYGQRLPRDVAEKRHGLPEAERPVQRVQAIRLRPLAYDAHPDGRDSRRAAARRPAAGRPAACAGTCGPPPAPSGARAAPAAPRRTGGATRRGRSAPAPRPGARAARRRPRGPRRPSSGWAPRRGRPARCCGAPSAPALPAAPHQAPLVPELVGDDALERHDEARLAAAGRAHRNPSRSTPTTTSAVGGASGHAARCRASGRACESACAGRARDG